MNKQLPIILHEEWNYQNWVWVDKFSFSTAKILLKQGFKYIELNKDTSDVTYFKFPPNTFSNKKQVCFLHEYLKGE